MYYYSLEPAKRPLNVLLSWLPTARLSLYTSFSRFLSIGSALFDPLFFKSHSSHAQYLACFYIYILQALKMWYTIIITGL